MGADEWRKRESGTVEIADTGSFHWTGPALAAIEHLAEYDVTPDEFEEIVSDPDSEDESRSTANLVAFGATSSGRFLCCVFKRFDGDTIEPVTAYEVGE